LAPNFCLGIKAKEIKKTKEKVTKEKSKKKTKKKITKEKEREAKGRW